MIAVHLISNLVLILLCLQRNLLLLVELTQTPRLPETVRSIHTHCRGNSVNHYYAAHVCMNNTSSLLSKWF